MSKVNKIIICFSLQLASVDQGDRAKHDQVDQRLHRLHDSKEGSGIGIVQEGGVEGRVR